MMKKEQLPCFFCGSVLMKQMRCGKCRDAFYCSRKCQADHWPDHKKYCRAPKEVVKKVVETKKKEIVNEKPYKTDDLALNDIPLPTAANVNVDAVAQNKNKNDDDVDDKVIKPTLDDNNTNDENDENDDENAVDAFSFSVNHNCTHQSALGSDEPCMECQNTSYERATKIYDTLKKAVGVDHDATLKAAFSLFYEHLILLYKLSDCDDLLEEIRESCEKRGKDDPFYIKMIQAYAFLRFKQFRYSEAVLWFEEMREIIGPSAELLENAGHAYNSSGRYDKAEECFTESLRLINEREEEERVKSNMGGVLLGLGLVIQRQGRIKEGLEKLVQGLSFFQKRYTRDHSLHAKARTSIAKNLMLQDRHREAEPHFREAVRVFRMTCGDESPLTANALADYGELLILLKHDDAEKVLEEALERNVAVDPHSIHLSTVIKVLISVRNIHARVSGKQKVTDPKYISLMLTCLEKLKLRGPVVEDADLAVLYKLIGEMMFITDRRQECVPFLRDSLRILKSVPGPESATLQEFCTVILEFVEKGTVNIPKGGGKAFGKSLRDPSRANSRRNSNKKRNKKR